MATAKGSANAGRRARPRAATIYEVAEAAGVAASTVSRAFTNPQRVKTVTRLHILTVAHQLGYHGGHPAARTLPRVRNETIGLLVPDITNPHFAGLIRGAERQAHANGFTLVLADTEESPRAELRLIDRLGKSVDGIVLGASRLSDPQLTQLAAHHRIALVNREVPAIPAVVADQQHSVAAIVEHLATLGHRSLAYLAGPRASWVAMQRWQIIADASVKQGLKTVRMGPFPPFLSGGTAAADALLNHDATAAITHNGMLGIGVLRRLAQRNIRVPDDISIVSCDDIFTAEFFTPPLTARVGPMQELGRAAVNLILELLDNNDQTPDLKTTTLPADLVIRGSTGRASSPTFPN